MSTQLNVKKIFFIQNKKAHTYLRVLGFRVRMCRKWWNLVCFGAPQPTQSGAMQLPTPSLPRIWPGYYPHGFFSNWLTVYPFPKPVLTVSSFSTAHYHFWLYLASVLPITTCKMALGPKKFSIQKWKRNRLWPFKHEHSNWKKWLVICVPRFPGVFL
jgi:hypothetical protein